MTRRTSTAGRLPALLITASLTPLGACDRGATGAPVPVPAVMRQSEPSVRQPPAAAEPRSPRLEPPPVAPGQWSENQLYKFRVDKVTSCAGDKTAPPGDHSWVGAAFTVSAKQPDIFVTPRDLDLRRGGVIIGAKHVNPPQLPGCEPLLVPKRLRKGESISGVAVFDVPRSFRVTTDDPIVLSYRPMRWGGTRRADVPIRECLDACGASAIRGSSGAVARTSVTPRPKL